MIKVDAECGFSASIFRLARVKLSGTDSKYIPKGMLSTTFKLRMARVLNKY